MNYQAVIFDLDGTLLDTLEDIAETVNLVLTQNQFPPHPQKRYKLMVGLGMENLLENALPETARDPETLNRVVAQATELYSRSWKNHTHPYPGIQELLAALKALGLKLAVLSNKPQRFTQANVDSLLPAETFDLVLGAVDDIPKKPAPDGALKIASELGLAPGHILYVGDSGTDMRTAKAAGMFAVGVTWGFRSEQELRENGADAVISRPDQVLGLIQAAKQ